MKNSSERVVRHLLDQAAWAESLPDMTYALGVAARHAPDAGHRVAPWLPRWDDHITIGADDDADHPRFLH